jgi:exonuclease III
MLSENTLVWNVQGLKAPSHRSAVQDLVMLDHPSLICLQETKMHVISDYDVIQILGPNYDYTYLPTTLTRGGIMVAWRAVTSPPLTRMISHNKDLYGMSLSK